MPSWNPGGGLASVLITGASKGIGRATAAEFARRGHRVIATAPDPRTLAAPADQRLALDVTNPDTMAPAVREAGEVDVLVANAGAIFVAAVEATPPGSSRGCWTSTRSVPCGWPRRSCEDRAAAAGGCCSCPASPGASRRRARRPTPRPMGPRGAGRGPRYRGGPAGDRGRAARTGPGQLRRARPRHHLHPARRSLSPPARPGRCARQPDDAGRGRGRDRRRGRGAAAACASPSAGRRRDPGRTPGRTRRPPVHPRCIHRRPVVNGK